MALTDKNIGGKQKKTTWDKFSVEQIVIENKKIVAMSIRNNSLNKTVALYDIRPKNEKK